jgi:hypothetical protein
VRRHLDPNVFSGCLEGFVKFFLSGAVLFFFSTCVNAEGLYRVDHDSKRNAELLDAGGSLVADYDTFSVISVPDETTGISMLSSVTNSADLSAATGVEDVSYMRQIQLNSGVICTEEETLAVKALAAALSETEFSGMRLVQFVSAVKGEWLTALEETGIRIVSYIPHNAYLVSGTEEQFASLAKLDLSYIHWTGEYNNAMRIQPDVAMKLAAADAEDAATYDVQLFLDSQQNPTTLALLETYSGPDFKQREIAGLKVLNCVVDLSAEEVADLAEQPDVISIHLHRDMQLHGERQGLVMADQFLEDGTLPLPRTDSYLQWLLSKGFTQQQFIDSGFIVDVTDDGFDNGNAAAPANSEFCVSNKFTAGSRVAYAEIAEGATGITNAAGAAGHGNLNLSIIGGYNDGVTNDVDPQGYHYGLGIAPFAMLGSTKIFADSGSWGDPNYSDMVARQYSNGARIHSDSWGADSPLYTSDSQAFDYLTRDATASISGNQEMIFVFSAGNSGPTASSMGSPGTAKNVFTVGGSENYDEDLDYTDGSGIGPSGADNVNDITYFSSRGPTKDGRTKPDIVAPAAHIHGAASQYDGYVGDGVSDTYNPTGQTLYAESSGTSHSCPAVSAASALLRQWFINKGYTPPSPAMNKAWIMNSARYLTGEYANDDLPSNTQGMGATSVATMLDEVPRFFADQQESQLFTESGQEVSFSGEITDTQNVVRVTLAWTDAPGPTTGAAYVNDLDLIVLVDDVPYYGNVFSNETSVVGGSGDRLNNVESVFLPAGTSGSVEIKVVSVNIAGDGVPGNESSLDQDFALVAYNADVQAHVEGDLIVTPSVSADFSTYLGSQTVAPAGVTYTLNNTGTEAISWRSLLSTNTFSVDPSSGLLPGESTQDVVVTVSNHVDAVAVYSDLLIFTNEASGATVSRVLTLDVRSENFQTEEFIGGVNDLSNQSLVFFNDGTDYTAYINPVDGFYQDVDEATQIAISDDGVYEFALSDGKTFPFFGGEYPSLYICANGRITFGAGSSVYTISLDNYFALPSISPMFCDLSPQSGEVSCQQLEDRAVVTFLDVPGYNETTTSSFQLECFFDGTIRMTYGTVDITRIFITGLSEGTGVPSDFDESDFSTYSALDYGLEITAPDTLLFTGIDHGETAPSALWFYLENVGDDVLHWEVAASSSNSWLSINGESSGTLNVGMTTAISVSVADGEAEWMPGTVYAGTLSFFSQETPIAELVPVSFSYEDSLKIFPERQSLLFQKINDATYAPEFYTLTITNRAAEPIDWQAVGMDSNQVVELSAQSGTLPAYQSETRTVWPSLEDLALSDGVYVENIVFSNLTFGATVNRQFVVRNSEDFFTQIFSDGGETLSNTSLLFVPDADNENDYLAYFNDAVDSFFVDPYSGNSVELSDDGLVEIQVEHSGGIPLYGELYTNVYINGNGRVTFGAGSAAYSPTYSDHFSLAAVAPLFEDLSPQDGDVYYEEFADRWVVTYLNVPEFGTENESSFQIEFFFNGNVRITYGKVSGEGSFLCGLSRGGGTPEGFIESDLSLYPEYPYDAVTISPEVGYHLFARKNVELETTSVAFSMENTSDEPIDWTAAARESWATMSPAFGIVAAGDCVIITARVENAVNSFAVGGYTNYIEFSNRESGQAQEACLWFEMQEGVGDVVITGSLPSFDEYGMPFGNQQVDVARTESLRIQNTNTQYPVKIENIQINRETLPVDDGFSMTNQTVLLYADDYLHPTTTSFPYQALTAMGASVTVYGYGEIASFYQALISQSWDMVVFSSEYYYIPNYEEEAALENALVDFANSGKPMIASSWCAIYWGSELWKALGADVSSSTLISEPTDIEALDESSRFFTQPFGVTSPITYAYAYFNYYGCGATLADHEFAVPVATFSVDTNYSVIYRGNSIYKGYADCSFDEASGVLDFWRNLIYSITINSFEKPFNYNELLPITIHPGETVEVPIAFQPSALGDYESELFITLDAMNKTNVSLDVTGCGVSADHITTGYSRWRDQQGDHLMITNTIDVGEVSAASIGGVGVNRIAADPLKMTLEFVFGEINSTNLLDVVYQARSGEYGLTNFFQYYSEYLYVSPSGLEINGFNSWKNASRTLQEAVDEAEEWALVSVGPSVYTASAASRAVYNLTASVTNVVSVDKNIVLRGVNNPIIHGKGVNRPVLMMDGCVVENMYLMNGQTQTGLNYFIENNGGGVWAESEAAVVNNLTLWDCHAGYFGGGIFGATVRNSSIDQCSAHYGGGLGYVHAETNVRIASCTAEYGGAVANSVVSNGYLEANCASFGGAATDSDLFASILQNNTAVYGGAIYGNNTSASVVNCLLQNNGASADGGAFYQNAYSRSVTSFKNCTIVENWQGLDNCGGVFNAELMNSIVYGNTGNDIQETSEIYYSNIGTGTIPANQGNMSADPLFCTDSSYELSAESPCIDAGSNELVPSGMDLAGRHRIAHETVDLGAYELPWYILVAASQGPGRILPAGTNDVPQGSNILFTAVPDEHYEFVRFTTNDHWVGWAGTTFEWENVSANGTISAMFGDIIITNGMPESWLAGFYPGQTNYNELAHLDTDDDGLAAWQEYVALTDPTNKQSVFQTTLTVSSNDVTVSWAPFDDSLRTYSLEASPHLFTPLNTISNELKNGSMTISAETSLRYFRANVEP